MNYKVKSEYIFYIIYHKGDFMEILIIDDDMQFIEVLKNDLLAHFIKYNDRTYFDTFYKDLSQIDYTKTYDFAFIDIDLVEESGVRIAKSFKNRSNTDTIIFVSEHDHLTQECMIVHPYFFIRKNYYREDLSLFLELIKQEKMKTQLLCMSYNSNKSYATVKSILFIEYAQRALNVHCRNHIYQDNRTLKNVLIELEPHGFVQVHKSFIVNLRYIFTFNKNEICLFDGSIIPIGKKYMIAFKDAYREFLLR